MTFGDGSAAPPPGPTILLSVCIVTHNNAATIGACIASAQAACAPWTAEALVVDNASRDATAEVVRREHPAAILLAQPVNRGFGAACNLALRQARGEYVLFLNPDTISAPGSLARLLEFARGQPQAGVIGCRLPKPSGRYHALAGAFPTFRSAFHEYTPLGWLGLFRREYLACRRPAADPRETRPVDWVTGAVMLLRRETALRLGGFDERFFLYYEDIDLCRRAAALGLRTFYFGEADVVHAGGHSANQDCRRKLCESMRSMMRFFGKYEGRGRTRLFKAVFLPLLALQLALELPRDLLRAAGAALRRRPDRARYRFETARAKLLFLLWDGWRVIRA